MILLTFAVAAAGIIGTFADRAPLEAPAPTTSHARAALYIEDLAGVRTGIISAPQRAANTRIINAQLSRGARLHLHAGTRIEIARTLKIGSGGGIVGDSSTDRPIIFLPAAEFNNTNDVADQGRYGPNAVGIDFSGELSGSLRPSAGVDLENLKIVSERKAGRRLRGIVGRNVADCVIRNVEISGFPMAIGIALASARRCRVTGTYIHDFADDTPWRLLPQSTGIEVDNDIIRGIPSSGTTIDHFRIERLRVGGKLLAKWGYQTDSINILSSALETRIADGRISEVGEGIDTFGSNGSIDNVVIDNAYIFGLKFIHGAAGNRASNVSITNPGLAGLIFAGSDWAKKDTAANVVTGIRISNIDPAGVWKANSTAGIIVSGRNSKHVPTGNQVIDAQIDLGPGGKYGWLDQSTGSRNRGTAIRIKGGRSLDRPILIMYGGGSVRGARPS